jgi:thiol-disulfide isomerase/thioredoxin
MRAMRAWSSSAVSLLAGLAGLTGLAVAAAGCEGDKKDLPPPPSTNRSNAVVVSSSAAAAQTATATATARAAPAGPPRKLCEGQAPKPAPKGSAVKTKAAAGGGALPASVPFGVGKWVWVNLWAAWCVPCKEEMPRLIEWQKKLSASGVMLDLAFVSIDDDERQLERFLEGQQAGGVKSSYWLPEGGARSSWMSALGLKETPDLPAHALVAPSGQVTCVIQGAVEERDYPAVAAFLGVNR